MRGLGLKGFAIASVLLSACAAPNLSRTVGRGNSELRASVGGPLFALTGVAVPFPHVNVGGRVGVTDWLDIDGNLNALALMFQVWAMDLAANAQLYRKPHGLAVATSGRIYLWGDINDAPLVRAFPEWGLHLGGPVPRVDWLHLYGGHTLVVSSTKFRELSPILLTSFMGLEALIPYRRPRWGKPRQHGIALHTAWTNPWEDRDSSLYYRPASRGAIAIYFGYRLRIGGLNR